MGNKATSMKTHSLLGIHVLPRSARPVALMLIVLLASVLLVASTPNIAQASSKCPPSYYNIISVCSGGDSGGHNNDDGGTLKNPKPKPKPTKPKPKPTKPNPDDDDADETPAAPDIRTMTYNRTYSFNDPSASNPWLVYAKNLKCKSDNHAGAKIKWTQKINWNTQAILTGSTTLINVSCINYQISEISESCVVESTATIHQTVPSSKQITSVKDSSKGFLSSDLSLDACRNSSSFVHIGKSPIDYGRYKAQAQTFKVPAVFERKRDPILNTTEYTYLRHGARYVSHRHTMELQIDCTGVTPRWHGNFSFTHTDCGPTSTTTTNNRTPIYQCVNENNQPAVSINGQSRSNAILFRDGRPNEIKWDVVRPSSSMNVNNTTTRWTRTSNGTPWRENGLSISQANVKLSRTASSGQMFTSNTATNWVPGVQNTAHVSGFWASEEGKATRIRPSWSYNGTINVQTARITSYDGTKWNWTTQNRAINSTAICNGAYANLTFVRATQGSN